MKTHFHRPCLKYLKERKVKDNKVYFYASQNASDQFKTKDVSTLIICNDNTVFIDKYNSLYDEDVKYAVSGAPIIIDGFRATTEYLDEGWDNSIVRPTVHGFLGVKDNYIYYFFNALKQRPQIVLQVERFTTKLKIVDFLMLLKLMVVEVSIVKSMEKFKRVQVRIDKLITLVL